MNPMNIGIVGAGNIGASLARRFTELGHTVQIANSRGPETLADVAQQTGATPTPLRDVARGKDIVVVAIPMRNVPELPPALLDDAADDVVVIDSNNYVPQQRDGRIQEIEDGLLESHWVSRHLGRPVIKAFNNIGAAYLVSKARPHGDGDRVALPVSGDNAQTKALVMELIDDMGFDPVDVGMLEESWRQQPGSLVYGTDLPMAGLLEALAATPKQRPASYSASR